jgi:trehalose 6-phosphate phosphatase
MDDLLERFLDHASRSGIFLDYDGTLSDIVRHADRAGPFPGVDELLKHLSARFGLVAIVSGRAVPQLVDWLGEDVEIWGVHGAQRAVPGGTEWSHALAPHLPMMNDVLREAERAVAELEDGSVVEDKGAIVGLHYRPARDPVTARAALDRIADDLVARFGLIRSDGRMVIELRPPVDLTKAAVVLDRARELDLQGVLFAGDDLVDLPAFDAVEEMKLSGAIGVKVAVDSAEAPPELIERADYVVAGPGGLLEFLGRLTRG